MNIIDHLSVGVPDITQGCAFYDGVMATLGYVRLAKNERLAAYGDGWPQFVIITPDDRKTPTAGNGTHVCFVARDPALIDRFHAQALALGGACAALVFFRGFSQRLSKIAQRLFP